MAKLFKAGIDNLLAVAPHVTQLTSRKQKAIQM